MTEQTDPKPRKRRWRRAAIWCGGVTAALMAGVVILAFSLIGTRLVAPDWLHTRITQKINADISGISLGFGEMSVVVDEGWVPRLALRNVVLKDASETPVAQLNDVMSVVALKPLLQGEFRSSTIDLSGARIMVRRARDGSVDLQLGNQSGSFETASSMPALMERLDAFLTRPHFAAIREISAENIVFQYEDARAGQTWTVDGGSIHVKRRGDEIELQSDLALLGDRDFATVLSVSYAGNLDTLASEFAIAIEDMPSRDIAGQSPALSWLNALDAPISGALRVEVFEDGTLGPLEAELEVGEGVLQPDQATRPIAFERASMGFTYDPKDFLIDFNALQVDSKWLRARVVGQTRLEGMEDGLPDTLISQFQVRQLLANPLEIYPEPVALEGATLDMRLRLDPFELVVGEMTLTDQGRDFLVKGHARAEPEGWVMALDAHVPEVASDRLLELWPELAAHKARKWVARNVKTADLSNIQLFLRAVPGRKPDVHLGFDFANLEAQFIRNVPFIQEGWGTATIRDNAFVIAAHGGYVTAEQGGRIDIAGSSFEIPDIRLKPGPGVVKLHTKSTVTAALSLLDAGPFKFLQKAGRPVTLAQGQAEVSGQLDFMVIDKLKPEDVAFEVDGVVTQVSSDQLINGRVLTADELWVRGTSEELRIGGTGQVGQVPFDGIFAMPLVKGSNGRAQVTGSVELSQRFLDEFRIGLPPGSVTGQTRGDIQVDFAKGVPPVFAMRTDLAGLGLRLQPLQWSLGEAETGVLEVEGTMGEPPEITRLALNAGGLQTAGSVTLTQDGQLQLARFGNVKLGNWIDAAVDLVGVGPNLPPMVRVLGGEIDLTQTNLAGSGATTAPAERKKTTVSLRLDKLQVAEGIFLTEFASELDMTRGANGTFAGLVNGKSPIEGRVVPRNGRSAFAIKSEEAGDLLRAANFIKGARDGSLELFLIPGEGPGIYEGRVEAKSLRIKNAPTLAALFNAISLVGILEQIGGEGIHFSEVEADFQLAPGKVTVYSSSAVGASMGISMEGYYYPKQKQLDVEGVFSPIYAVNALGAIFSRKGEGLLGFTYAVDGSAEDPRVRVNPLSVFTPGIFREIFRRPAPLTPGQERAARDEDDETDPTGRAAGPDR